MAYGFHPAGLMKDRAEIGTKLSTDFAKTLAKEGAETVAALHPALADPVLVSGKQKVN